jgi:spore maturation protein SpmA
VVLGGIYGSLYLPVTLLEDSVTREMSGLWALVLALILFFGCGIGIFAGFLWGMTLGLLQAFALIGLEKMQLTRRVEPKRYRLWVIVVSVTISTLFVLLLTDFFVPYLRTKEQISDANIFFLPSIIATVTFATIAVKTASWSEQERNKLAGSLGVTTH